MTKDQLQKELKAKVKAGIKPSDLKKLKRSKSADDLPSSSVPNPPLPRSKSQLEIPLPTQPSLKQQISSLQDELTTERKKVNLLREDLSNEQVKNKQAQEKVNQLEDNILQLRCDKIKEFADYLEQKQALTQELELNITAGTEEINHLETKLWATNKKKLELQQQLGQQLSKNAQLKSKLLDKPEPRPFNSWPILTVLVLSCLAVWLFKNHH